MADKKNKIGFGRQLARASALSPLSGWAILIGVGFAVFFIARRKD